MPPVSVLSAPPPPSPGGPPEAPAIPGSIPKLSLAPPQAEKPPASKPGTAASPKAASDLPLKVGGKPAVKPEKTGKKASVLRKRAALSPIMKAGVAVIVVILAVGGFISYRTFFTSAPKVAIVVAPPIQKPPMETEADLLKKSEAALEKANEQNADGAKTDGAVSGTPTPTPTPILPGGATVSVLAQTDLTSDVKVNSTHLDAAPAASEAFRAFVANASIGGVFQGTPSRALVNGSIAREGQVVDNTLGIAFERIDSDKKMIFFRDSTGAEVSKGY
jgi:hypothetical protein